MKEAPPILGKLEFAGRKNNIILIEHDEDDELFTLLNVPIGDKTTIVFTPNVYNDNYKHITCNAAIVSNCHSISRVVKCIKGIEVSPELYIIDRIDMMDIGLSKRPRGAQICAYVSMMASHKVLRGATAIITSCQIEHRIRTIADQFISLRK